VSQSPNTPPTLATRAARAAARPPTAARGVGLARLGRRRAVGRSVQQRQGRLHGEGQRERRGPPASRGARPRGPTLQLWWPQNGNAKISKIHCSPGASYSELWSWNHPGGSLPDLKIGEYSYRYCASHYLLSVLSSEVYLTRVVAML
jgi:hypothetical protein